MKIITKSDFRKDCIKKLKFCSKTSKLKKDKYISNEILKIIKFEKPKNILLYLPLDMEVDIRPLINGLRKERNYKIFVPYMVGDSLKIVPFRLPLKTKKYKIKEPNFSNFSYKVNLDLAIVPIIGYDESFRRVGFGVGFYDRFFSSLKKRPKTIFTQLCSCKATNVLTLKHDVKADYIISSTKQLNASKVRQA
ncbi:MAG: 5-formyltetrahydrofolate cyclo-ligase [Arcobacteraceae bacterium]|nr:5-formyltetrahydrofolate cyclo-ligase [Arcobacteraceae bacterium]